MLHMPERSSDADHTRAHWMRHAPRWSLVGPPLRPPAQDVAFSSAAVHAWLAQSALAIAPRALVLGVTPELVCMDWPRGTRVLASDMSIDMIRGIWPGPRSGHRVVCADWLRLPLADGARHVIVGDGSFNAMARGGDYPALAASLRRVIHSAGIAVLRFFVRPPRAEPLPRVLDDLRAGRFGSFHVFKWHLVMAVQGDLATGVRLGDAWDAWHAGVPDPAPVLASLGWPPQLLQTIDGYRGADASLTFPTLDEARAALAPHFIEQALHVPAYEMGERCPTLVLRPR